MCLVLSLGRVGLLTGGTERERERKGKNPAAERKKLVPIWPLGYEKRDNSGGRQLLFQSRNGAIVRAGKIPFLWASDLCSHLIPGH